MSQTIDLQKFLDACVVSNVQDFKSKIIPCFVTNDGETTTYRDTRWVGDMLFADVTSGDTGPEFDELRDMYLASEGNPDYQQGCGFYPVGHQLLSLTGGNCVINSAEADLAITILGASGMAVDFDSFNVLQE